MKANVTLSKHQLERIERKRYAFNILMRDSMLPGSPSLSDLVWLQPINLSLLDLDYCENLTYNGVIEAAERVLFLD